MRATRPRTLTIAAVLLVLAALAGGLTVLLQHTRGGSGRADPKGPERIDLASTVAQFTSRFGPGHGYRQPGPADRQAIAQAVGQLLDGHRAQAEKLLAREDFSLRTVVDRVSGRHLAEVADRTDGSASPRGWGRVYLDLDHRPRWSVQVPHPVFDRGTEQLGVRVLRGTPGGVLIIAGAHRKAGVGNSADVAHRADSVFSAVCAELARRGMPGVQLHGFAASAAPDYDAITSTGTGTTGVEDGRRLADALTAHGFSVCRAWARTCPLEGTLNVQGHIADADHVSFLHVELSPVVRAGGEAAERAVAAIGEITRGWDGSSGTR